MLDNYALIMYTHIVGRECNRSLTRHTKTRQAPSSQYEGVKHKRLKMIRRSEMELFVNRSSGNFKPSISEYKGNFFFVGSVPEELGYWDKNSIGQDIFRSNIYKSKEDAQKALEAIK